MVNVATPPPFWRLCARTAACLVCLGVYATGERASLDSAALREALPPHADNWVVLVGASRYWFNYRHMSNTLAMYHTVKRLGVPVRVCVCVWM